MTEKDIVKIYKALSVDSRLQILKLIKDKELCVNAITQKLNITQPAVSQHLSVLKEAGLVKSDRYGSIIHYSIDRKRLGEFTKSVQKYLGDEFILLKE
ncbi:winged helix-turn-helix transcriptional regulator [candidate division KSB1 bacterium]|nr:winged helix-turn-helix transcriptional regulator [candidate division KSB1 bacterium]